MGALLLLALAAPAFGQSTSFTYQGRLTDGGTPANGNYDFIFQLYDTIDQDNLIGHEVSSPAVPVSDGIFSVTLDFGANAFPGADRFLQIIVRRTGDAGIPTLLSPRQKLTSTPYAIRSLSAVSADNAVNATQLGGTTADQFVLTGDARLSDARPPAAGSGNYIQNSTAAQPSSDFNITGTGRAKNFDANQYSLFGARVLSNAGTSNLFAGEGAGEANNLGNRDAFFGYHAGLSNTIGDWNSFFGNSAGQTNKDGRSNDFFGDSAGLFNSNGSYNSIFGSQAGTQNTTGSNNTFIGNYAGQTNTTGNGNTTIGFSSNVLSSNLANATAIGANARVDASNSLVLGSINGVNFATADTNVGIGTTTPRARLHVIGNSVIEGNLNVTGTINGNFSGTIQTANNALNLGGVSANQYVQTGDARLSDARPPIAGSANYIQNGTTPQPATNFNVSGTGQAATFDAATQFNLAGTRVLSNAGTNNFFAGQGAGQANASGFGNSFFGSNAGAANDAGNSNAFFGNSAGAVNTSGSFNAFFGSGSGRANVDGTANSFFGYTSGRQNASGANNSFFGNAAGFGNTNGINNSFFGWSSGKSNTLGQQNTFVGALAGQSNLTGGNNTLIGYGADVAAPDNSNATAIGAQAFVAQANSLVLGAINGVNGANFDTNVGIGTTAPSTRLHVVGDGLFTGNLTVNGNLNGNFSLTTVNAVTQYNLAGVRVLSNTGTKNFFAGQGTGNALTTGSANAFFGANAGALNNSGSQNSFFGSEAGNQNSTGAGNSFFGAQAGKSNTAGLRNSFFGGNAGLNNTGGGDNAYFGVNTGLTNSTGSFNAMFGNSAGQNNTTSFNSFFGSGAGQGTTTGDSNTFFGQNTGNSNSSGAKNAFFGTQAGAFSNGSNNAFFGTIAGVHNQTGSSNTALGDSADLGSGGLTNATAVGSRALVTASNALVLGSIVGFNGCSVANNCSDTNVGIGTTSPNTRLHVVSSQNPALNLETTSDSFAETQYTAGNYIWRTGVGGANVINGAANKYYIYDINAGQFRMAIDTTGNLGIGTTGPTSKLHVVGDGLFTGNLTVNGTINGNFTGNFIQNTTTQQASSNFNISGNGFVGGSVGVGTTSTQFKLNVVGANTGLRVQAQNAGGSVASFGENGAFLIDASAGPGLSTPGGRFIVQENGNVGIGTNTPSDGLEVVGQGTAIRATDGAVSTRLFSSATASKGYVGTSGSNSFVLRTADVDRVTIDTNGNVGIGTDTPEQNLQVTGQILSTGALAGFKFRDPDSSQDWTWHASLNSVDTTARLSFNGSDYLTVSSASSQAQNTVVATPGSISVDNTADLHQILLRHLPVGGSTPICRDDGTLYLGNCSSSLRYKTNLAPFSSGLSFIRQLRPISFDWKSTGRRDIGFGAEDVAKINPLFVTYNEAGQVEGVKYDRFSTVFVNAFKEQQTQIDQQQDQIRKQQTEIDELKKLVCADHPNAEVCKQ
jgi:hypothetical protein